MEPIGHDGRTTSTCIKEHRWEQRSHPTPSKTSGEGSFEELLTGLNDAGKHPEPDEGDRPHSPSELALERRKRAAAASAPERRSEPTTGPPMASVLAEAHAQPTALSAQKPYMSPPRAPHLRQITRPLKITPLSSLTGSRATRNRVLDVLALVVDVAPDVVRRPKMPEQRDLRIVDPSTRRRVQLTVFVDAASFTPSVGTPALFRNVTTHEWNGGSLKAYPRDCEGTQWFFPNPAWVEGYDAAELRGWWLRCLAEEQEEQDRKNGQEQGA